MKNDKIYIIALGVIVALLISNFVVNLSKESSVIVENEIVKEIVREVVEEKEVVLGRSSGAEFSFINRIQNTASVTATEDDDVIAYAGDITATLSVGDAVRFDPYTSISGTGIETGMSYYVKTASSSGFDISKTRGGDALDITADFSGGDVFYEEIDPRYFNVADSRHITIYATIYDAPSVAFKFVGSIGDSPADFYASRSDTNQYEYIAVYDIQDAALITGDTGLTYTGTDDHRIFTVNTDELQWIAIQSTNYASGSLHITGKSSD